MTELIEMTATSALSGVFIALLLAGLAVGVAVLACLLFSSRDSWPWKSPWSD